MTASMPPAPLQRRCQSIALGWLAVGAFVLALTPLDAHDERWGWTPLFWLLLAPLCLLTAMRPAWPLNLLAHALRARRRLA